MSKKDWLVERLTGSKKGSPRWVELAAALEEYWNDHFFDDLQELENSKNIFTANSNQLDRIVSEQGDFFDVALPIDDSGKRLGIAWRREEIHKKNTSFPINSVLNRNFNGLPATWQNVYAPVTGEYDRLSLYTEYELKLLDRNLDDYWLTSRGRLLVDLNHMKKIGMSKDEFLLVARREIERVRPTHIVYDGELFILTVEFDYQPLKTGFNRQTLKPLGSRYDYFLTSRFDEQAADVPCLDESPLGLSKDRTTREPIAEFKNFDGQPWSLDLTVDLGDRQVPIAGVEGDVLSSVRSIKSTSKVVAIALNKNSTTAGVTEIIKNIMLGYDLSYQFDGHPADIVPVDDPIHALSKTTMRTAVAAFQLGCKWSLGQVIDLGDRQIPVTGIDGDKLTPLQQTKMHSKGITVRLKKSTSTCTSTNAYSKYMNFDLAPAFDDFPSDSIGTDRPIHWVSKSVAKPEHEVRALAVINDNPMLGFDEIPADFAPLDTPLWT